MRRTKTVVITAAGRDIGKQFALTEMPAVRAEKWAARFFLALAKSGVDIPDDIASAGLAGVAAVGFRLFGGMRIEEAEILLDEMFQCVKIIADPMRPEITTRALVDRGGEGDDIEEIATRVLLRKEVFGLHVDFSALVALSKSALATGEVSTPSMPTSPAQSVQ